MTTYDSWIEQEEPEDKDALINALEREVRWLRSRLEMVEYARSTTVYTCTWCKSELSSDTHLANCETFTPDGKVRSKFL